MQRFNNNRALVDNTRRENNFLYLDRAKSIILYPSLCMPITVARGSKFIIILQVNDSLVNSNKIMTLGGATLMQRRINLQLRYYDFKEINNPKTGQSFESLPSIINVFPVANNKDVSLKDDECNFSCNLAKDILDVYKQFGYKYIVMLKQDSTLSEPVFLQWLDVIDFNGKVVVSNNEHKDIIINELNNMGVSSNILSSLKNIHPIFPIEVKEIGVAHLSDLHISSRVSILQANDQLKNIDGGGIANKVHNPIDSIKQLLWSLGEDNRITCIWITGDIVDFHINVANENVASKDPIDIWEKLNIDLTTINSKGSLYADIHRFYGVVIEFYNIFKKPIYFIFGNHDAYEMPYGISPRILQSRVLKKGIKANATIPMDHNLTFYEAILLFGPGYNKIVTKHYFGDQNYKPHLRIYYFLAISPLLDIKFELQNKCFVGIDWGDEESIIEPVMKMAGTLPRASGMLNDRQINIIKDALNNKKELCLFMHAPIINYDYHISLITTTNIPIKEIDKYSKYDSGSFKGRKSWLLQKLLKRKGRTVVFSGHSHRFANYQIKQLGNKYFIEANGYESYRISDNLTCIVSASAGPMAARNIRGEWLGHGIEPPSGTVYLKDNIYKKESNLAQAKPRLCVIMDSIDILSFKSAVKIYTMSPYKNNLDVEVDHSVPCRIVKINLLEFSKERCKLLKRHELSLCEISEHMYKISPLSLFLKLLNKKLFLEVFLYSVDKKYCPMDPWLINVEVKTIYEEVKTNMNRAGIIGYKIIRRGSSGEIPDFSWHVPRFKKGVPG